MERSVSANRGNEQDAMRRALELGEGARQIAPPNPWVGAVVISADGLRSYDGATRVPGESHAEIVALKSAGSDAEGGTLVVTLEPCSHTGRTGPCSKAIHEAGIARVVVGVADPDVNVQGQGITSLQEWGIDVEVGMLSEEVERSLAAYLCHRRTGRPFVVVKLASTLDGQTAAADRSSQWITSEEARADVAKLRASCDAILVGAGTVRDDNPTLTARTDPPPFRQPERFVLGEIPDGANVLPARSISGSLEEILDQMGKDGILQLLVEGGASVAHDFIAEGLADRLVLYLAPVLMGGNDGSPVLKGPGAPTIAEALRGRFVNVSRIGDDLRMEVDISCP